jgi:hypothetical protein
MDEPPPSTTESFERISTHETLRNAKTQMQLHNGHNYVYVHNTGTRRLQESWTRRYLQREGFEQRRRERPRWGSTRCSS